MWLTGGKLTRRTKGFFAVTDEFIQPTSIVSNDCCDVKRSFAVQRSLVCSSCPSICKSGSPICSFREKLSSSTFRIISTKLLFFVIPLSSLISKLFLENNLETNKLTFNLN